MGTGPPPIGTPGLPPLVIQNLADFVKNETEIVARINGLPNGARLLIANPFRALADVNVNLSTVAADQLRSHLDQGLFAGNPLAPYYDDIRRSAPPPSSAVTIKAILKPLVT
jgi:hypothetical protein